MSTLKNVYLKESMLVGTKANGRVESRRIWIDGIQTNVKVYSLRNKKFGAFELLVPVRSGVNVLVNQEVEITNPRLFSVGRVNTSQRIATNGEAVKEYVGYIERSIIADGLTIKGGK